MTVYKDIFLHLLESTHIYQKHLFSVSMNVRSTNIGHGLVTVYKDIFLHLLESTHIYQKHLFSVSMNVRSTNIGHGLVTVYKDIFLHNSSFSPILKNHIITSDNLWDIHTLTCTKIGQGLLPACRESVVTTVSDVNKKCWPIEQRFVYTST